MAKEMAVQKVDKTLPLVKTGSLFFDVAMFDHVQRVAKVFASSDMVPAQFKNNIPNCIIGLNLADRMQVDPFMLFQNMYIVHGNPGIEAKLAIALTNGCGRFEPLQFKHENKNGGDSWGCIAYAKDIKSGKVLESATVSIAMAKKEGWYNKNGSKWQTMPELMLEYRSAMFFARVYCPEVLLGLKTREEIYDIVDLEQGQNGTYSKTPEETLTESLKKENPEIKATDLTKDKEPDQTTTDEIQAGQERLNKVREQDRQQPQDKTLFEILKGARSQFKGMAINRAEEIKKTLDKAEIKEITEKWNDKFPGEPDPFHEPALQPLEPPFETDTDRRFKFLKAMRAYKEKNDDIYASVLMDNELTDMNAVKPGDEQAILGFMAEEFNEMQG